MKKLAILINSMNRGGAERVVSILLEDLINQYEIFLVLLHPGVAYKIPKNVKINYLSHSALNTNNLSKAFKLIFLGYKYFIFCKNHKIDISLSLLNRSNYINILSKFFGFKCRVIISERGTTIEEYPENTLKGRCSRLLIKWLYPKANAIIAISKGIASDLTTIFGVDPKKVTTIYNPINLTALKTRYSEISTAVNDEFNFIAIGRLDESKNFQLLLRAFAKLDWPAKLTILGDGPLRNNLKKLITSLNLEDKACLSESVADIFPYLKNANCVVVSSSHEGFSNVIVEALGCGKVVIATDCKYGPSEILAEKIHPVATEGCFVFEKYGVLVPLNDHDELSRAMNAIINNKKKRDEYETLGQQRANYFNKDSIFFEYLNVLENNITVI